MSRAALRFVMASDPAQPAAPRDDLYADHPGVAPRDHVFPPTETVLVMTARRLNR
jgi:hypothetical protein